MKKSFFILSVILCSAFVFLKVQAQNEFIQQTDSLKKIIASSTGEKKLHAYQDLIDLNYPDDQIDTKIKYAQEFAEEA